MTEATEDPTKRRSLVPVGRLKLDSEPDMVHLSVLKWIPACEAWATGMTLCGRSAEQGALPTGTPVTCRDCEGYRDSYERALSGRPTVEQEEIAGLRAQVAAAEATLRVARFTAEHWRDEMMKSEGTRLAAHPCAMILTALNGETDPVECGIDEWAQDAFRVVVAADAPDCRWPACLSEADQQLLADQVGASMLGEETALMPDPRPVCGCVDRGLGSSAQELRITVTAPTPADAERWTRGIQDMVEAEFGDGMRLDISTAAVRTTATGSAAGTPMSTRERLLAKYPVTLEELDADWDPAARPNMEDCPLCTDPNPPYPWICPGHPADASPAAGAGLSGSADIPLTSKDAADIEGEGQ